MTALPMFFEFNAQVMQIAIGLKGRINSPYEHVSPLDYVERAQVRDLISHVLEIMFIEQRLIERRFNSST